MKRSVGARAQCCRYCWCRCLTLHPENTQECPALAQLPDITSSALTRYMAEAYGCLARCQARETFNKL